MGEIVTIERMGFGPEAVAHLESGKAVFVEGGAPGDVLAIELTEEKHSFARARIVEVKEPAACRVAPTWAEPSSQGVAPWQHLAYETQLAAKTDNVVAALSRTAGFGDERAAALVRPCLGSKRQWGYRNKIELGAAFDAAGMFQLGFHDEGCQDVVASATCPVAYKQIERAPKALRGALRFAQGADDLGIFRVGVRHSVRTHSTEVALWTTPAAFPRGHVANILKGSFKATSIVRVLADPGRARKIKGVEVLDGKGFWEEKLLGFTFRVAAPSFFQVNTAQAEKLIGEVIRGLGGEVGDEGPVGLDEMLIADLYSGGGTFSIPLAAAGADVIAVESAGSSVRDLRRNADANGVDIEIIGGDAARELPELGELDALVVDPPRAGLADGVVESIAAACPERVAYVSCNPATWARDVARFEENGYKLLYAQPVDLFPQTYHVETVAVLSRKSATKTFIPVTVSPKDMGLDEAKAQPTYENIRKYVKETHGLTVSTLNIAQMKAECGLEMECDRSGGKQQPKCPPEKREAILDAFRHFGMIEDDSSEG